ncbi:hypothetical protein WEI85_14690 [Actinomycetes bacterium KLBMP 9797]
MAKEVRLTVPDDVAEVIAGKDDPAAFVTEAVRRLMVGDVARTQLREAGFTITDQDMAEAQAEVDRLHAQITPEARAKAAELYAEVMRMRAGVHG